jgi:hypothetical protein
MLEHVFLFEVDGGSIKFADDDRKLAAGIAENGSSINALNAVENEGAAGASSVRKAMLSQAIRVPGHKRSLQSWSEAYLLTSVFETTR